MGVHSIERIRDYMYLHKTKKCLKATKTTHWKELPVVSQLRVALYSDGPLDLLYLP